MRHEFTVPIGIADAWETFNDLERIAPCFPGAQITSVDGDDFTGLAKVKLGPISLQYTGKGHWNERDASAYRAVIEAKGKDKRGNGTAAAVITAYLEEEGSGTRVVVETDLKITGRPAQFGRGVIQDVGSNLLDQFAQCLATKLGEEPAAAADATGGDTAVPAPVAVPAPAPAAASADADGAGVSPGRPVPPRPLAPPAASAEVELDLGSVVLPMVARRFGPTALACLVTALVTWAVARRRR
jgi:carbon monoxide dehydrogenase subunit G